jgi:hypothetical protein
LAISALAATYSAYFAYRSAKSMWLASQSQLTSRLLDSWASPNILDACIVLTDWKNAHGDSFADEYKRMRREDYDSIKPIDHARRLVSHHFQTIYFLGKEGLLEERLIRNLADEWQVNLYCTIVEPLEDAVRQDYDKSSFIYFAALYGIKRSLARAI